MFLIALLVVGAAVLIALNVADRLVKPVEALVDAARRVSGGDLTTRVDAPRARDELGTLAGTFNQMTERLEGQHAELIEANNLLDRRRAVIESILSGVSAGVISITQEGRIRVLNRRAEEILKVQGNWEEVELSSISHELGALAESGKPHAIVDVESGRDTRTLSVNIVPHEFGEVLTFDDITNRLADQRRAAWSDVARRVAHEIKNPLTPIQLAAERLKRKFARGEADDPAMLEKLTDTIIRQVGDLRRMVDEFSSFARMPKPVFREELVIDICRQALFLHEVAHPEISFTLDAPDPAATLVCDRRQLGQALTNIIKNAVEAIEQRAEIAPKDERRVMMSAGPCEGGGFSISVADTGIGLPSERERIVEPYMTTRKTGTGLGLAIVTKIAEEHGGRIEFADRTGRGAIVTLILNPATIPDIAMAEGAADASELAEKLPRSLSRNRKR